MTAETDAASVLLYAELLPNIRQISVGCLLPSTSSRQTKIHISPDGEHLIVHHNRQEASLKLPGRAKGGLMPPVLEGQSSVAFRLPVLTPDGGIKGFVRPAAEPQVVPWSATDIPQGCPLSCRQCGAVVVAQGVLSAWKDLPSENWAEMMEFWHCHKPDEHKHDDEDHGHGHGHDHLAATRGYGASSRIAARPGLGFVDLTSLLVSTSDVLPNILDWPLASTEPKQADATEVSTSNNQVLATCRSCKARLALVTPETSSVTLFKWQVNIATADSVATTQGTRQEVPSVAHCISAMLLATLSRTGCSKSILMPINTSHPVSLSRTGYPGTKLLHIWLFNPNITYSSSVATRMGATGSDRPQTAVKVLFRFVDEEEADKLLHSMTSDTQDISLPVDAIETMTELLGRSNDFLPPSERVFKEWTVGLVSRWQQ